MKSPRLWKWLIAATLMVIVGFGSQATAQGVDRKESPFEELRWVDDVPEIKVNDEWYKAIAIDGIDVAEILEYCEQRWPDQMRKRFGEDLVEAMQLMGHEPDQRVDLTVIRLSDNERLELEAIEMTRANRQAIVVRVARLVQIGSEFVMRAQAQEDINEFASRLEDQFAYIDLKGIDWRSELEELSNSMGDRVSTGDLAEILHRLLMQFGDGHARVSSPYEVHPILYPPFLLAEAGGGVVAITPDRQGFLAENYPYVVAIDGHPVDDWISVAAPMIAAGSEQLVRHRGLRSLRSLELLREALGIAKSESVICRLARHPNGEDQIELTVSMIENRPTYGPWPRRESSTLAEGIGYLRIPNMDNEFVPHLRALMRDFRDTHGLIVDVRGNGGGTRSLLIAFAGYLLAPDQQPWVGNIAKYKLSNRFSESHLDARFMYRANHPKWNTRQRKAIESTASTFDPEWTPGGTFSEWHYLVLDRTGHEDEYHYDKPIIILCDAECFSATDIFLGALSGRPKVTIMGAASSGGSARTQRFILSNTNITVQCASMASFRPDGCLYDGHGVEVDVEVPIAPADFLLEGTDTVLDAAIEMIAASMNEP